MYSSNSEPLLSYSIMTMYTILAQLGRQSRTNEIIEKINIVLRAIHQDDRDRESLSFHVERYASISVEQAKSLFGNDHYKKMAVPTPPSSEDTLSNIQIESSDPRLYCQ